MLYTLALQALHVNGEFCEFGVYKGGTAILLSEIMTRENSESIKKLHLFDTFEGMPVTDPKRDLHQLGDFNDTSLEQVKNNVGKQEIVVFHPGVIPDTFKGMESKWISFAHVDVDIYKSVWDCCVFIYPRLEKGGMMIFDDYGFPSCPGARQAVDQFFKDKPEEPLVLSTGQAIVFRSNQA